MMMMMMMIIIIIVIIIIIIIVMMMIITMMMTMMINHDTSFAVNWNPFNVKPGLGIWWLVDPLLTNNIVI